MRGFFTSACMLAAIGVGWLGMIYGWGLEANQLAVDHRNCDWNGLGGAVARE